MEAASNTGVRQVESDYILVHDDDDSLDPNFLTTTVGYLESEAGSLYGGVVTGTDYVSEEIQGDKVVVYDRYPYLDWVRSIDFSELMAHNTIPTIAFLYRRKIFEEVGGYREDLPVLGDWYFNIEFVLRSDVRVLPQVLAHYHHRDRSANGEPDGYSNSVIQERDRHEEFAARCRNALIREHLRDGGISAGLVMGYFAKKSGYQGVRLSGRSNCFQPGSDLFKQELELDRLWVLALVLHSRRNQHLLSLNKIQGVELECSLIELAQMARKRKVEIRPPDNFDDSRYLMRNPDVAAEVQAGNYSSGYEHYALHGHLEGRLRPARL